MNLDEYKKYGKFTLSSGKETDYYYDLKEGMGTSKGLLEITSGLVQKFKQMKELPDVIIGLDYGGIPLVVFLSLQFDIPYAVLRKEQKSWGTRKMIEGYQGKGRTIIIDDVETTGASLDKAEKYLTVQGYNVIDKITVIKRAEPE